MDYNIPIAHVMTTNLITVKPTDNIQLVDEIFSAHLIHHIPVVQEGKLVGILSKSDFLRISHTLTLLIESKTKEFNEKLFTKLLVEEVMTKQVAMLNPEDPLSVAVGLFKENLFHAIPVVDKDNTLIGLVTTYDLLNYCFSKNPLLEE